MDNDLEVDIDPKLRALLALTALQLRRFCANAAYGLTKLRRSSEKMKAQSGKLYNVRAFIFDARARIQNDTR